MGVQDCQFGLHLQTAACHLAFEKLFCFYLFKDEVLSVSIWKRAMVLPGPFVSLQSGEVTNTSIF